MVQMVDTLTQLENWVAHFTKNNPNKYCCKSGTLPCIITALIQKALDDIAISADEGCTSRNNNFVKVIADILHATISNPIMAINRLPLWPVPYGCWVDSFHSI